MDLIRERGGHFCLQPRRNQKNAFEDVELYFRDQLGRAAHDRPHAEISESGTVEKCHGRIETRTYRTISEEEDIRNVVPESWGNVHCLGMAVLRRDVVGDPSEPSEEVHYHVMDVPMTAEEYGSLARGHWSVENTLHHVLDVQFGEDRCTAREGNAVHNLSLLRKIAFNIVSRVKGKRSTRAVMTDFMLEPELFLEFLYGTVPAALGEGSVTA